MNTAVLAPAAIKAEFPGLAGNWHYLDTAATAQKPQAVIDAALRADPSKMPALLGVDLGLQGFAVVRVNKIVPRPESSAQQSEQSRQQFARLWGQAESQAYLASLKSQFKVEMLAEKPKKLSDSAAEKP